MATQDQVKIVRIKNRLDTAYRSTVRAAGPQDSSFEHRRPQVEGGAEGCQADTPAGVQASGGYRDLCINLRIVTEETEAVGVDHHI
eukprot:1585514-Rhodomonas_salina.2